MARVYLFLIVSDVHSELFACGEHDNLTLVFELSQSYPIPTATDMSTLTKKMPAFIKSVKNAKYVREKMFCLSRDSHFHFKSQKTRVGSELYD